MGNRETCPLCMVPDDDHEPSQLAAHLDEYDALESLLATPH